VVDEAAPDAPCHLAVVPPHAFLPAPLDAGGRRFGLAAQIYGLRREGDQGIGDLRAVAELARTAREAGAALLGLSPPHALFPHRTAAAPAPTTHRTAALDPISSIRGLPLDGELPAVRERWRSGRVSSPARRATAGTTPPFWTAKRAVRTPPGAPCPPRIPPRRARAFRPRAAAR
jgi:hypothetical protein